MRNVKLFGFLATLSVIILIIEALFSEKKLFVQKTK